MNFFQGTNGTPGEQGAEGPPGESGTPGECSHCPPARTAPGKIF